MFGQETKSLVFWIIESNSILGRIIVLANNIFKKITKVLFPRNKVFLNQIGRAFYYKRRFLQVKSRVLKQPLSYEIPLSGGEKIYYKIPAWDPSANEVFLTKGLTLYNMYT